MTLERIKLALKPWWRPCEEVHLKMQVFPSFIVSREVSFNRSLFFTEDSAHKMLPESLKTAAISFLSAVRTRHVIPVSAVHRQHVYFEMN